MKNLIRVVLACAVALSTSLVIGCGGEEKPAAAPAKDKDKAPAAADKDKAP